MLTYLKYNAYGFHFKGDYQSRVAGLHAIGRESRTEHTYSWNGLEREEKGRIVFQYTLHGEGAIRIGKEVHPLKEGDAFMVRIPSDHCYYLPEHSTGWDFIYLTVYGDEASRQFQQITGRHGHVFHWPIDSRPVKHILKVLGIIETTGINHGYEASNYAYAFLMECMQYLEYDQHKEGSLPVAIAKAVTFMTENYQKDIGLDDIVAVSGLSKYHFTRLFARTLTDTPIQFLTKRRMQHALEMLRHTDLAIDEIARSVGYANSNYFSKVFKKSLGESPSKYRQRKSIMPVDRWFID